jgi:hypothetical protein
LHRTVGAAGRRFDDVAQRCAELFDDSARWNVLARLQQEVAGELERRGLQDRELARMDALAAGRIACDLDVWIVGVAEMPLLLRGMLHARAAEAVADPGACAAGHGRRVR